MNRPEQPPVAGNIDVWRDFALSYLREQMGADAPSALGTATLFERSPLEGEGAVAVFSFKSSRGLLPSKANRTPASADAMTMSAGEQFYVVVGETESNYYPLYGLSPDDAFSLHLGTRFMLVMGIGQRSAGVPDTYDAEDDARRIVSRVSSSAPVEDVSVAAEFDVEDQVHAVLRARVAGRAVYIMGRDAPMGFVERVDLPAPAAYRLHLGRVLRAEPDPSGVSANG